MKISFTLFCTLFLLIKLGYSQSQLNQNYTVVGTVTDTSAHKPVKSASISLLHLKDSILYQFVRTDENGTFKFKNVDTSKYILLVSTTGYADYVNLLSIGKSNSSVIDLKEIPIVSKSILLQEVIIKYRKISAIKMNGDTLEFKADSFKVQPNAKVEDLLRQLPNIQIDNKGVITAQGQIVKNVLVDGEEFFGDDPTLVTKNIRADIVDKVQIYDRTSKQAAFTGVDDGVHSKTINITLKEDKKNGYFGNAEAGLGTRKVYEGQIMLNVFRDKEKFAAYGLTSNNGLVGLSSKNQEDFAGGGTIGGSNGLDTWNGNYNGQGIPTVQTAGTHYNNKWVNDKYVLNGNYKVANLDIEGNNNIISQFSLPNTVNYINTDQKNKNHSLRNKADINLDIKSNPSSYFNISVDASTDHKNTLSGFSQQTINKGNILLNSNQRNISNISNAVELNSNILWNKKFAKKGRTLSINFNEKYNKYDSKGYLNSETNFHNKLGLLDSSQKIDQFKINGSTAFNFESKGLYSEPLSRFSTITGSYKLAVQNSKAAIDSYNKSGTDTYDNLDSQNSNSYEFNQFINRAGLAYNFDNKKTIFNISNDVEVNNFSQIDKYNIGQLNRQYLNWYPQLRIRQLFSPQRRISFSYNGQTIQPTINQLQPIINNIDPLNLYIGNSNLNPSFKNTFNLIFSDFLPLKNRSILVNGTYTSTNNSIVVNTQTDSTGRNIYTYSNLSNASNSELNTYVIYSINIKPLGMMFTSNSGVIMNRYINFNNGIINITNANIYSSYLSFMKSKDQKYNLSLSGTIKYNSSETSLEPSFNNNYWSYELSNTNDLYFSKGFQLHTDCRYNHQNKTSAFNNFDQVILNVWVGKSFLNNALLIKVNGNDLLNQNSGFNRIVTNNLITQNNYTTIRRNLMISVTYNLNKTNNNK